jgi:hypothetical protein
MEMGTSCFPFLCLFRWVVVNEIRQRKLIKKVSSLQLGSKLAFNSTFGCEPLALILPQFRRRQIVAG